MRRTTPNWSTDEVMRLELLVDEGRGYDAIAQALGRSRTGVVLKARRLRHRLTTTTATLSARDVAEQLGLGCSKTVVRWARAYDLPARNAGTEARPLWRIQPDDLLRWLERPEHWMMYDVARVADPATRAHLGALQAGGPRWLPIGEAADQLGVTHRTVNVWIANGLIPGAVQYGNWWIADDVVAAFEPPCERPRDDARLRHSLPVIAPRRTFPSVYAFAVWAGATCQQVMRYLDRQGGHYVLRPLAVPEPESVVAPRRTFPSVYAFAVWAGASCKQALAYLVRRGDHYALRSLTEAEYQERAASYRLGGSPTATKRRARRAAAAAAD